MATPVSQRRVASEHFRCSLPFFPVHTAACFRNDAVTNSKVQWCGECDNILSVSGLSDVCKNSHVDRSSMRGYG